jgi:hypothetical protein
MQDFIFMDMNGRYIQRRVFFSGDFFTSGILIITLDVDQKHM